MELNPLPGSVPELKSHIDTIVGNLLTFVMVVSQILRSPRRYFVGPVLRLLIYRGKIEGNCPLTLLRNPEIHNHR